MPTDDQIILITGETIPLSALEFTTSRSGGPGGQNVNKVETQVEVRLELGDVAAWLGESTLAILAVKLASRIDKSGAIRLRSSTERTQRGNRIAALNRLEALLNFALKPEKKRHPSRPTKASREKRLESKKKSAEKKSARKWTAEE